MAQHSDDIPQKNPPKVKKRKQQKIVDTAVVRPCASDVSSYSEEGDCVVGQAVVEPCLSTVTSAVHV